MKREEYKELLHELSANYDYREAVCEDICEYIRANGFTSEERLNDELWAEDSVTGNGSGSYTFDRWMAEENLNHNWDLLEDALCEFGYDDVNIVEKGAEWCDVTIRCYVLGECISQVVGELRDSTESWWGELGFEDMELVTGFRQDDFSPEDGYQEFVDACDEWWNDLDEDQKINIYLENYE